MTLLFSCEYGSRAMGLSTDASDHDVMKVYLEPPEYITGLSNWKPKHFSTAGNARSGPGDTDTTVYALRHWAQLAARGNPTAMTPLFVAQPRIMNTLFSKRLGRYLGDLILEARTYFISKDAGLRYGGYARGQMLALRGARNKKTNRPELVHEHGYDTKFGYHALRTLMQGAEMMQHGTIQLPIPEAQAGILRQVREGKVNRSQFSMLFELYDGRLNYWLKKTKLPDHADIPAINKLLHEIYLEAWHGEEARGS